jgi:hypothetical protein
MTHKIRLLQLTFAGAAAVAALALFGVADNAGSAVTPGRTVDVATAPSGSGGGFATNDDDNTNPSSGDIFTQNAQDQSTA